VVFLFALRVKRSLRRSRVVLRRSIIFCLSAKRTFRFGSDAANRASVGREQSKPASGKSARTRPAHREQGKWEGGAEWGQYYPIGAKIPTRKVPISMPQ